MSSSEEENEFDDGNDESSADVPVSSLREEDSAPSKRRRSQVNYAEDGDEEHEEDDGEEEQEQDEEEEEDSDEEDDVPLSALASPASKKTKSAASKKSPKKKPLTKKKKTSSSTSKSTSSAANTNNTSSNFKSASDTLYSSECDKGLLVQRLLCRWWYAIEWPSADAIPDEPPMNYDPLDGFPGVYVCTQGDDVGDIKDLRDKSTSPNFNNMAKKSAEVLQELLIKALTEQRRQLIKSEGEGTETQKEIDKLLKWAKKVNVKTADKKAASLLKAAKFSLD